MLCLDRSVDCLPFWMIASLVQRKEVFRTILGQGPLGLVSEVHDIVNSRDLSSKSWGSSNQRQKQQLVCFASLLNNPDYVGQFYINLPQARLTGEQGASVEKLLPLKFELQVSLQNSFLISDLCGKAQSVMGGTTLVKVDVGSIRKQVEHAMGSKPISSTSPPLLISSCLQVLTLFEFMSQLPSVTISQRKPFLPFLLWIMVFQHNNSNPN